MILMQGATSAATLAQLPLRSTKMSDSVAQQLKEATINDLDRLAAHAEKVVKHAQEIGSMPSTQKMLNMVFSADTASRLVGRNRSTLSRAGKDKLIPEPSEYIVEKPKK